MASSEPNYLLVALSLNAITLRVRASPYESGGTQTWADIPWQVVGVKGLRGKGTIYYPARWKAFNGVCLHGIFQTELD